MSDLAPLEAEIRRPHRAAGPMPVAEYMALCLAIRTHGYYITRDPLGAGGDFITAPEISQMFGELLGLWAAAVWQQMGAPENVRVVELGPGRGTMMLDALRAAKVMPGFRAAVVGASGRDQPGACRRASSRRWRRWRRPVYGIARSTTSRTGPAIVVANEFFDALPVSQAVKQRGRLARARWSTSTPTASSPSPSRRDPFPLFRPDRCRRPCATRRTARSSNGAPTPSRWSSAAGSRATAAPRW